MQVAAERELTELAGTRDHQGVVAFCEPYRYADAYELARRPQPLARLPGRRHRSTQPRRRLQERGGRGRDRPRPARTPLRARHAGGLPRLGGRRRASPGRRRAQPRSLHRGVKGPSLWAYAAVAEAPLGSGRADFDGGVLLVLGAEGKGIRPLVRRQCDVEIAIPLAGKVESLNVSVAAALLLFEVAARGAAPVAPMPDPTLYLFDGYNILHAGGFRSPARARRSARGLRRRQGARGIVVFDGAGTTERSAASRCATRRRGRPARAARRRAPGDGARLPRLLRLDVRGTAGRAVEQRSSSSLPRPDFEPPRTAGRGPSRLGDRVDDETRARSSAPPRRTLGRCTFANSLVTPGGPCYRSAST